MSRADWDIPEASDEDDEEEEMVDVAWVEVGDAVESDCGGNRRKPTTVPFLNPNTRPNCGLAQVTGSNSAWDCRQSAGKAESRVREAGVCRSLGCESKKGREME